MNKKGFTLIELLSVIIILGIILVIAVPKILNVINISKRNSLESSAKFIAGSIASEYQKSIMGIGEVAPQGNCEDVTNWDINNGECTYFLDDQENVNVSIFGNDKFSTLYASGTKDKINIIELNVWETQLLGATNYASVYFHNETWVAVGDNGTISTSSDGFNWTTQTVGINRYRKVYANNGIWVAVGDNGMISTSLDGFNWTTQIVETNTYYSIYANDEKWVAVGRLGTISTSSDGFNWTTQQLTIYSSFKSVYYYNGLWVIAGESGRILTSSDGEDWITYIVDSVYSYVSVFGDNNRWVLVGGSNKIVTSTNGITWTKITAPGNMNYFNQVYANNGVWFAIGNNGISRSTNGTSWSYNQNDIQGKTLYPSSIYSYNNKWIASGGSRKISTLQSLNSWSTEILSLQDGDWSHSYNSIHADNGMWVTVGSHGRISIAIFD